MFTHRELAKDVEAINQWDFQAGKYSRLRGKRCFVECYRQCYSVALLLLQCNHRSGSDSGVTVGARGLSAGGRQKLSSCIRQGVRHTHLTNSCWNGKDTKRVETLISGRAFHRAQTELLFPLLIMDGGRNWCEGKWIQASRRNRPGEGNVHRQSADRTWSRVRGLRS